MQCARDFGPRVRCGRPGFKSNRVFTLAGRAQEAIKFIAKLSPRLLPDQLVQLLALKTLFTRRIFGHAVAFRQFGGELLHSFPQQRNLVILRGGAVHQAAQGLADRVVFLRDTVGAELGLGVGYVGTLAGFAGMMRAGMPTTTKPPNTLAPALTTTSLPNVGWRLTPLYSEVPPKVTPW